MATYEKRIAKRDGHWTYGIQIKVKDFNGKDKFVNVTWSNPDNLTGKRAEKAAIAFGENWEREYKNGRIKQKQDTFLKVANEWLDMRRTKISLSHYVQVKSCIDKMAQYFGDCLFVNIKAREVCNFLTHLNNYKFESIRANLKPETLNEFENQIKKYGFRKVEREGVLCRPCLYYVRKGQSIAWTSAEKLCKALELNINHFFEKEIKEERYARNTIIKYQRTLSSIFNYAIKHEIVETNYASFVYTEDAVGGREQPKAEVLSDEEYRRFIRTLKEVDNERDKDGKSKGNIWTTIPLYLLSLLGLRSCEVCGLKWCDINLKNRIISIVRDRLYVSGYGVNDGKTKNTSSMRDLYIDDLLYSKLNDFKKLYDKVKGENKDFDKSGYIFCGLDGKPRFPQYLNTLLKRYLAKANCKQISNHKMRHTWITRLISNGAAVNKVSGMAGHSNIQTTLEIYTDNMKDVKVSKEVLRNCLKV